MKMSMMAFAFLFFVLSNPAGAIESLSVRSSETLVEPTEVRYWDQASTYDGYTLFASRGKTYLIDMEGRVVHTWNLGTNPRLLDYNGHLLDATKDDPSGFEGFRELDWDGHTVWEYVEKRVDYAPHHDWVRIYNKKLNAYTTLYIANKSISHDEAIAAGCDPANGPYDGAQMDAIVEVDMDGNVVWEWWFFDHVIQDVDATKANYVGAGKAIADYPGRVDLNLPGRPLKRDWLHCNSLDYNAERGQIVTNSVQGEFYVIDHDNTFIPGDPAGSIALAAGPTGDFLYRFGDPARYEQGDPPTLLEDWTSATSGHKQLGGSHDIQWIKPGLPGAGHFLVFNNGQYLLERTPQSYIFEINGFLDGNGTDTGHYLNPPDAGYYTWELPKDTHKPKKLMSKQIVWIYHAKSNQGFFSHIGSGAQRLPNGNTLICAMTEGHFFEVTPDNEVVWEYINPVTNDGIVEVKPDSYPMSNAAFRAYRYGADHPALSGRNLTPGSTITGKTPNYLTPEGTATGTDPVVPTIPPSSGESWSMNGLPDTGQTGDYTTSRGEDSDYTLHAPSYTNNGDGTVTDNVTGLMWQQTDGGEMTWERAQTYAEGLSLGGYQDWRLPSSHELFSLIDLGRSNPAIDVDAFADTGAEYWWSANARFDDPSRIWAANAGGGIGAHPKDETLSAGGSKKFHVWCVRGAPLPSGRGDYFVDNADETVLDRRTGLMWQQREAGTMTWEDALIYAENLSLAGYDDWRLPNIKELRSINDDGSVKPSIDRAYFPNTSASRYWSSTTLENHPEGAWFVNFDYGLVSYDDKAKAWSVRCVRGGGGTQAQTSTYALIPAGTFEMGDHHDLGGLEHGSDEIPIHSVSVDSFYMGTTEVTVRQYCNYLNAALSLGLIEVRSGVVYGTGGSDIYFETRGSSPYSRIGWDGSTFAVLDNKDNHPVTDIRWHGAAAYCNWLSVQNGLEGCYDVSTWTCDFSKTGFRLPTEAEWEYAARGGQYVPYRIFPWGDNENTDGTFANWPRSGDPYEAGDYPWTTPVGFYNGGLHQKADFDWPGTQGRYQTSDGSNAYGLYDMSGNVWEWCNDWYNSRYYGSSPSDNPTGADVATPMPDGNSYHVLRSGNWFNGEQYWGHARIANRNPAYYRGPDDPNHAWYHVGFRVVRSAGVGKAVAASGVIASGAVVEKLAGGFALTEGPAVDKDGNVFFTDIPNNRIHKWSVDGKLSVFRENSGGANGLFFDPTGNLLACEGDNGRVVSIDPQGNVSVLADQYGGKRFNKPNDLWIDARIGVYFSDPIYGQAENVQGGEHVYYLKPKRDKIRRVVDDMVRPNGLIGSPDGKTLYVADHGAGKTYRYDIDERGDLGNKTLFASRGSDGMTVDTHGNVYLTDGEVVVFDSSGRQIETIAVPERPTNVCFGGKDRRTLFITAQTSLYSIRMSVEGVRQQASSGNQQPPNSGGGNNPPPSGGQAGQSLNWDIGLIVNEPEAYEGYTLFAPKHYTTTYLMDNAGRIINSWESNYEPGQSVHLLPNGHLLHTCFIKTSASIGGGEGGRLEEYDWEGNLVWEFDYYTSNYAMHHDVEPLPNGNIIALVVEKKTEQECIAAGFRPEALRDKVVFPEYVVEIEPIYPKGGRIVWQWHVWDHLVQDNDPTKANYGVVADHSERISVEVNGGANVVAFWNHMNSIDYNPQLDQIMLSVRGCSELWVIDHSTTTAEAAGRTGGRYGKGGDLIYRWGNPAAYGAGNASGQTLFQQHDTQWIEPGLPGEGNILVFNNGLRRLPPGVTNQQNLPPYEVGKDWGYSSVDEIVPPVDTNGFYYDPHPAYGPAELTWTYVADPPVSMFAEAISGAQRLPNGNTLICDGTSGILLEVTPEGRTVWKYVCPVDGDGPMKQGDPIPLDERSHAMNAIFKVHRYAPDYPGLVGKDLTPGPPLVSNVQSSGSQKTGDLDGDGVVNFTDFLQFAQQFGKRRAEAGFNPKCDLDGNGEVSFEDFLQFARSFGTSSAGAAKPTGQNSGAHGTK